MKKVTAAITILLGVSMLLSSCGSERQYEVPSPSTSDVKQDELGSGLGDELGNGLVDEPGNGLGDELGVEYKRITPQEAMTMMTGDAIILDVRTQEEFEDGHIGDAILLPYDQIGKMAQSVLPDRDQIVLIYCRSGRRSEIAARELIDMGYVKVFDFGGIVDWPGEIVP